MEAQQVHRRRALREDRRHRRPRPDRRPRRAAAVGVRHERHRLRPVRRGRPGRPDGRAPGLARRAAARRRRPLGAPAQDPETVGLIGDEQLATVKPSLILVNAARGGIVDEARAATPRSRRAGSPPPGSTSSPSEPCTDSPLFELDNVVATPHLGASTDEAQEKAGVAVARSVRLALAGDLVPDAVNVQGGVIAEDVRPRHPAGREARPVLHRARRRRRRRSSTSRSAARSPRTTCACSSWPPSRALFTDVVEEPVSYVNAPLLAAERGVEVAPDHRRRVARLPQPGHAARHAWPTAPRSRCPAR